MFIVCHHKAQAWCSGAISEWISVDLTPIWSHNFSIFVWSMYLVIHVYSSWKLLYMYVLYTLFGTISFPKSWTFTTLMHKITIQSLESVRCEILLWLQTDDFYCKIISGFLFLVKFTLKSVSQISELYIFIAIPGIYLSCIFCKDMSEKRKKKLVRHFHGCLERKYNVAQHCPNHWNLHTRVSYTASRLGGCTISKWLMTS